MNLSSTKAGSIGSSSWFERLRTHLQLPLYQNGYALLFSGVSAAGLGLVYWLLAARLYPPATVGLNSALIAAVMFLAGIAQLGLNSLLTYFLPRAGTQTGRLIRHAYLASTLAALLVSGFFLWGIHLWTPELSFLRNSWGSQVALVLAVVAMAIFTLQDSVLIGLRQSLWVPVENTAVALVKVFLLFALASSAALYNVTVAWLLPVLVSLLPVNWYIVHHLRLLSKRTPLAPTRPFTWREMGQHMAGNYAGGLFFLASTTLLPMLVTQLAGVEANAYFYMPWMITTGLHLIPQSMAISFTVEATHDGARRQEYYRKTIGQALRLLLPLVALISLGAPWILACFGPQYAAEGTLLLRLLPWALLPNLYVAMYLSMARLQNRMGVVVVIQGAICLLMLGLSYLGLHTWGISGVGAAWLATQTTLALTIYALTRRGK